MLNGSATDELTGQIEHAVKVARMSEQWRSMYMKERALYMDLIEEGSEQGQQQTMDLIAYLISEKRMANVERASKDPEYLKQLMTEYAAIHASN